MTTAATEDTAESILIRRHQQFLSENEASDALAPFQRAAIGRFETLGFPGRKHEMYTFVNTKELVATPFAAPDQTSVPEERIQSSVYPGCEKSHLVFVDGVLRGDLSDLTDLGDVLAIKTLAEAVSDPEIKQHLTETIENENDVFASINSAFMNSGSLLEIPQKTKIPTPLQILYVSTGGNSQNVTSHPRVLLKLGCQSELDLIVRYVGVDGGYFVNAVQDIFVAEDAGIRYTQVQQDDTDSWHCSKTRIRLARNSRLHAANASYGNRLTRQHLEAHLTEPGSELRWNAVSVLTDEEQVHHFVRIHHESPHGVSHQHFKNIVNDKSRSSVDGTVVVDPGAQLTSSDQLINNLMLSDTSHADNKPNLMIFADDVKCTHGATIGQIDEEQLFYLKTRGLSQKTAKELLTKSFAESIIETVEFPGVRTDLENTLLKKLEN